MPYAISSTYTAAHGDSRSPSIAETRDTAAAPPSPASTDTSPRNPATVVSLSPAAWSAMQPERPSLPTLPERGSPTLLDLHKITETSRLKMELSKLDKLETDRAASTEALGRAQAGYNKMRDSAPKAAVLLNAEDTAKALQMLKDAGHVLTIPKGGTYGYVQDGIQYMFRDDGTVTVQQEGVATSPAVQREALASGTRAIAHWQNNLRDTSSERAALMASLAALSGDADATD